MASEIGIAFMFLIQTGLALLTVLGACFCIASHFFFQPTPASQHSTFREANWPPAYALLQTRGEQARPASSHLGHHAVHIPDGGKLERNTKARCSTERSTRRSAVASSAKPHKTDRRRTVLENSDEEERSSISTAVPTDTRKHPVQASTDHKQHFWLPPSTLESMNSTRPLDEWRPAGLRLSYSSFVPEQTRDPQAHQQGSQTNRPSRINPLQLPPSTWQPPETTSQRFRFPSVPPSFSGAFNERSFLEERNQQLNRAREAGLLETFDGFSIDPQNHTHEYDVACRGAPLVHQDPAAFARSVEWNRAHPAAPSVPHAEANLDHPLPNVLKKNADPLHLHLTSRTKVHAESPKTSVARECQEREIAELCRMATAIESLLSSTTKRASKGDGPDEVPVLGAAAAVRDHSASGRRAGDAESAPPVQSEEPLAEPASSAKQQNGHTEESSDTLHTPAKRDASAVEHDSAASQRNEQNCRAGCRLPREPVKKPRVGVMTNVLLLICSHQNKDYKAGRVRLRDWCRRNAGSLSPDQCASATAKYFCTSHCRIAREDDGYAHVKQAAKKGGSTADFEAAVESVKQLRLIFCPSAASFFEMNILEDLMCESDLALFSTAVWLTTLFAAADNDLHEMRLSKAVASLKIDGQLLLKAAICFSSTTLKPEFSEKDFSRVLAQLSNAVLRRSSRIRLTKTENQTEKEIGKEGQVEYGSSWQPLLNELRANCEHLQSEARIQPKRRASLTNAETDEACATQQFERVSTREAARGASTEVCKHEQGFSNSSTRSSKKPTATQPQPEGQPSRPAPQAAQHDLLAPHCSQRIDQCVKPEKPREAPEDAQDSGECNKRQRRTNDSISTTGSSRESMQEEKDAKPYDADAQGSRGAAAAPQSASQQAELRPPQAHKKTNQGASTKPPPQSCVSDSLAGTQAHQSASSSRTHRSGFDTPQQNRAKKNGGGNSQPAAEEQTRRYNTRSRGVTIKNER